MNFFVLIIIALFYFYFDYFDNQFTFYIFFTLISIFFNTKKFLHDASQIVCNVDTVTEQEKH